MEAPQIEADKNPDRKSSRGESDLVFGAAADVGGLAVYARRWGSDGGHFADHGEHELFVIVGKSGGIFLDVREEADFFFRKLAQHLAGLAVSGRIAARKKVGEGDFRCLGNFGEGSARANGMAFLDTREVTSEQAGAALDIALVKSAISAVRLDHFPDINLWFLFGHGIFPLTRAYLTSNPQIGARDISTIVPHQNILAVKRAPAAFGCRIPLLKAPPAKTARGKCRTLWRALRPNDRE